MLESSYFGGSFPNKWEGLCEGNGATLCVSAISPDSPRITQYNVVSCSFKNYDNKEN